MSRLMDNNGEKTQGKKVKSGSSSPTSHSGLESGLMAKVRSARETLPAKIIMALIYAAMIALILVYFSGQGEFIYEALGT